MVDVYAADFLLIVAFWALFRLDVWPQRLETHVDIKIKDINGSQKNIGPKIIYDRHLGLLLAANILLFALF